MELDYFIEPSGRDNGEAITRTAHALKFITSQPPKSESTLTVITNSRLAYNDES